MLESSLVPPGKVCVIEVFEFSVLSVTDEFIALVSVCCGMGFDGVCGGAIGGGLKWGPSTWRRRVAILPVSMCVVWVLSIRTWLSELMAA